MKCASFEELLAVINLQIERSYGVTDAIHTIVMDHEAFDKIIPHMFMEHGASLNLAGVNDLKIHGIRVLARQKE